MRIKLQVFLTVENKFQDIYLNKTKVISITQSTKFPTTCEVSVEGVTGVYLIRGSAKEIDTKLKGRV